MPAASEHPAPDTPSAEARPQWFVLGAGAMGCLWSAAMVQHLQNSMAAPVTLLLKDSKALQNYPGAVTIEHNTAAGERHCSAFEVPAVLPAVVQTAVPGSIPQADALPQTADGAARGSLHIKRLLLTCKAHEAEAAIAGIAGNLDDDAIIVLLQNGVRFQQQLSLSRPVGRVFCLSTSFGAWLRSPFHAVAAGQGESWLGHLYKENTADLLVAERQLLAELPVSAMNIRRDPDMQQRLWQKLAINCAINGLSVIYNCRNGELLSNPAARAHCQQLCAEITGLMQEIPQTPAMPDLWSRVQQVAQSTAMNLSSTLQDVRRGKTTEIQHFNGYLCELAMQHQLPCPLNQQVLDAVLESARLSVSTATL